MKPKRRILSYSSEELAFEAPPNLKKQRNMSMENNEANSNIQDELNKMSIKLERVTNLLERLTEEVLAVRHELKRRGSTQTAAHKAVLPAHASTSLAAFNDLEKKIIQAEEMQNFVKDLGNISGSQNDFVRKCWQHLMTDAVAQNFSWMGTQSKKAAKNLSCTIAIKSDNTL